MSDSDPFEGVELGDELPEPTQEEIDDWATLDTDEVNEPASSSSPKRKSKELATRPTAPEPAVKVPEPTASAPKSTPAQAPAPVASSPKPDVNIKEEPAASAPISAATAKPGGSDSPAPAAPTALKPAPAEASPENSELAVAKASQPGAAPAPAPPAPVQVAAPTAAAAPAPVRLEPVEPEIEPALTPTDDAPKKPAPVEDELLDEDEEGGAAQQQHQQGGAGWGWGWGTGLGLGALGGKLREVARGAVRDVKDLTETFQAALADVTGAEDEEEEAGRLSALDRAAEAAEGEAGAEAPEAGEGAGKGAAEDDGDPTHAPRPEGELMREGHGVGGAAGRAFQPPAAAAAPARGGSAAGSARGSTGGAGGAEGGAAAPDPALEVGLQAIDAQVEQLASGAAKAFSSLWGGLSSVAKVVAAEVAASVADVQSSEAVRGVAQIGTQLAHTAERGLERVGRTAMTLLEEVAGVSAAQAGRRRIWGEEADARAADMGHEPSNFKDFFYIYGGEQLSEEVDKLSNECSHLCNKSRAKLEADQQAALDEAVARLLPYFNDPWVHHPAGGEGGAAAAAAAAATAGQLHELDESSREAAERLGHMYDPIGYLCQDSLSRSEAFLLQLREAVEAAARLQQGAAEAEGAEGGAAATKRGSRKTGDEAAGEDEEDEDEEDEVAQREEAEAAARQRPRALLDSFRAHFTKRMAEVTTAQLQLLLNLGASLVAPARTGRPAPDGIAWPDSSEQQAALLATEARRMVADLVAITAAYLATVDALRQVLAEVAATAAAPSRGSSSKPEGEGDAAGKGEEGAGEAAAAAVAGEGSSGSDGAAKPPLEPAALDELAAALRSYSESAGSCIKSRYKGLLYAVLLRRLVTRIAQQEEEQQQAAATATSSGGKPAAGEEAEEAQPAAAEVEEEAAAGPREEKADASKPVVPAAEEGVKDGAEEVEKPEHAEEKPVAAAKGKAKGKGKSKAGGAKDA
ncbi:hypothetical protein HYH02_013083 [Chlamydomonas schloesseri]|uniref:DUF7798 domain-containing protein n=1 Tax=Chlamydomonas schloesseri TaxID=2026947 RepID=A0A835VWJ7_9CHLO|nr:hypothetical protein HYH02_013083 [Chlamydomonas schloesseri]|eukprot:KAG2432012.1 hypothetical protein HYH02_013083 [Chlamydomonas schloesseri]